MSTYPREELSGLAERIRMAVADARALARRREDEAPRVAVLARAQLELAARSSDGALELEDDEAAEDEGWTLRWEGPPPARKLTVEVSTVSGKVEWTLEKREIVDDGAIPFDSFTGESLEPMLLKLADQEFWTR